MRNSHNSKQSSRRRKVLGQSLWSKFLVLPIPADMAFLFLNMKESARSLPSGPQAAALKDWKPIGRRGIGKVSTACPAWKLPPDAGRNKFEARRTVTYVSAGAKNTSTVSS